MKEIKPLEDMIVAILLAEWEIQKDEQGRRLHFRLDRRKLNVFWDYLNRFKIIEYVSFDPITLNGYIKPSIMLERILKEWTGENQVQRIDPRKLRLNMYLIWVGLFAKKTFNGVAIKTSLGKEQQRTLAILFNEQFDSTLIVGNTIQLTPFSPILLRAVQSNRPIEECIELSYLLPQKEKKIIKQKIIDWEEERSTYAY